MRSRNGYLSDGSLSLVFDAPLKSTSVPSATASHIYRDIYTHAWMQKWKHKPRGTSSTYNWPYGFKLFVEAHLSSRALRSFDYFFLFIIILTCIYRCCFLLEFIMVLLARFHMWCSM